MYSDPYRCFLDALAWVKDTCVPFGYPPNFHFAQVAEWRYAGTRKSYWGNVCFENDNPDYRVKPGRRWLGKPDLFCAPLYIEIGDLCKINSICRVSAYPHLGSSEIDVPFSALPDVRIPPDFER